MDAGGFPAAGTLARDDRIQRKTTAVQIFLHMGDDHIALGHLDAVAGHQLQPLNEREVVETGPCYLAPVDLHRVENGYRSDLAGAGGVPLNALEAGFKGVILKLVGYAVLIVMAGAPAGLGVGDIVVGHHDPVNRDIVFFRQLL